MNLIECWIEYPTYFLDQTYSYISDDDSIVPGVRVAIEFNHKELIGFVDSVTPYKSKEEIEASKGFSCKPILRKIDEEPYLSEELIDCAKWMASETISPTISCFKTMLPSKLKPSSNNQKILTEKWVEASDVEVALTPKQLAVYSEVVQQGRMLYTELRKLYPSIAKTLVDKGALNLIEEEKKAKIKTVLERQSHLSLSATQQEAISKIRESKKNVVLLHGITGSGKTEIYLQLASEIIERGNQVLILVPEISLTPQMVSRVQQRFGEAVAIYHSGLNDQEKYEQYQRVKRGEVFVVVGTRSSIFMPFERLGLIILDEEHDSSYKQDNTPQYHCRDVAIHRGEYFGCKVLLGSATPSLDSYARALRGVYELVEMKNRINENLPKIHCVNLKDTIKKGQSYIVSNVLKEKLTLCLEQGKQAILLLNRRGYNTSLRCNSCGEVLYCPHCDVALSYHAHDRQLKCHTCGTSLTMVHHCPKCHSISGFSAFGFGTQKLAEEISKLFPHARIVRMDADTTSKKNSHETLLETFASKQADILIGTQMIAKGLDYPDVTLVGVLNADAGLNRIDYRSTEMTFDLIVQASGRSGRSDSPGEVILQVFDEKHYAIQTAIRQDYVSFFHHEMQFRKAGGYPPYTYLTAILIQDRDVDKVKKWSRKIKDNLQGDFKVLGPSELLKIKDLYRMRVLLKGKNQNELKSVVSKVVKECIQERGCPTIKVDVNPMILD